jgi:Secretion system C-terminal sorting domain
VYKRALGTTAWGLVANALPPGTGHWIDSNVSAGSKWEYQIKRLSTYNYNGINYDATGYTAGCMLSDNSNYKGQLILLVAADVADSLATKYLRLKKELTGEGWFVKELLVPRATNWDSGNEVVIIKNQIINLYNAAPIGDKPKALFILGHVPMPRSGSTAVIAPDDHNENKGARGCDAYYADIDGVYTDTATYNPGGLATSLAINLPSDFKWDQDFFPSDVEMAFGRVDFADITEVALTETQMLDNYLDRLSNYKNVASGFDMGDKTAFYNGYDNSNDGSFRSLPNISKPNNFYQNYAGPNHNEWVQNNGPFKGYMQNISVPEISDWQTYGMDATVYASDQSYWGFGDVPQTGSLYSRIRALLGINTKCIVALWTTTGINIFHEACTGAPIGIALKNIMNHNGTNQYLEKPQQTYDTDEWWNRTHFQIWGDPTVSLYQVAPATNVMYSGAGLLQWAPSADANIIGYDIYESNNELGLFAKINTALITNTFYQLPNYTAGNWYMIKAIKIVESGCGFFKQASVGKTVQIATPLAAHQILLAAKAKEQQHLLNWQSTNTVNCSSFEVQSSLDGFMFEKVADVHCTDFEKDNNLYTFNNNNVANKKQYYRIKQVDKTANKIYSNIVAINARLQDFELMKVAPNPTTDWLYIQLDNEFESTHISILDAFGRVQFNKNITTKNNYAIDMSKYSNGIYTLIARSGNKVIVKKIVKK